MGIYIYIPLSFPLLRDFVSLTSSPHGTGTAEWWRLHEAERSIALNRTREVNGKTYYEMQIDGRYAGEFRYSALHALYRILSSVFPNKNFPAFPPKFLSTPSTGALEERRKGLERYMVFILSDPEIVSRDEFLQFVRERRRWSEALPLLASPLIRA